MAATLIINVNTTIAYVTEQNVAKEIVREHAREAVSGHAREHVRSVAKTVVKTIVKMYMTETQAGLTELRL